MADTVDVAAVGIHNIELLIAAAVGVEDNLFTVGRIARRGVNGVGVGNAFGFVGTQIHFINIGFAIIGIAEQ